MCMAIFTSIGNFRIKGLLEHNYEHVPGANTKKFTYYWQFRVFSWSKHFLRMTSLVLSCYLRGSAATVIRFSTVWSNLSIGSKNITIRVKLSKIRVLAGILQFLSKSRLKRASLGILVGMTYIPNRYLTRLLHGKGLIRVLKWFLNKITFECENLHAVCRYSFASDVRLG